MNSLPKMKPKSLTTLATATLFASTIYWWYMRKPKPNTSEVEKTTLMPINLTDQNIILFSTLGGGEGSKSNTFSSSVRPWKMGWDAHTDSMDVAYLNTVGSNCLKPGNIPVVHQKSRNHIIGLDDLAPAHRYDMERMDVIVTSDVAEFIFQNVARYQKVCRHVFVIDPTHLKESKDLSEKNSIGIKGLMYYGCLEEKQATMTSLDFQLQLTQARSKIGVKN